MGGTGVSFGHSEFINSINPALLINNKVSRYDSLLSILEASLFAQTRKVGNNTASQWSGNVNFNSFAYAFPVSKRWTTSVGIHPYSLVSYATSRRQVIANSTDTALITNSGHGGIYQADFANGIKLHRNLSIGIQASYLFGTIHRESFSQVEKFPDSIKVGTNERTFHSGFLFRPGVAFRKNLTGTANSDSAIFMNLGFTYEFFGNMEGDERIFLQRKTQYDIIIDQSTVSSKKININLPATYRFGVSFDKHEKWNVGADFSYSDWSSYESSTQSDTLKSSFTLAAGAEFLVNFKKERSNKENWNFKKNYVRAGFSYTKTPVYINGKQINDVSLSLGYTLSVGNVKTNYSRIPLPKLNLALVVGQRGTLENNLIKDLYFKAYVGMTINDKWFRRRRID